MSSASEDPPQIRVEGISGTSLPRIAGYIGRATHLAESLCNIIAAYDSQGMPDIQFASICMYGDIEALRSLHFWYDVTTSISRREQIRGFRWACRAGHVDMARLLCEMCGFTIDTLLNGDPGWRFNYENGDALWGACANQDTRCVKTLIALGMTADHVMREDDSALRLACENDSQEIIQLLCDTYNIELVRPDDTANKE